MRKIIAMTFVAALAAAGCKKDGGPAAGSGSAAGSAGSGSAEGSGSAAGSAVAAAGGDCDGLSGTIDRLLKSQMQQMGGNMPADLKAQAEKMMNQVAGPMKDTLIKACKDDKWSAEAIACMSKAASAPELDTCEHTLTADQRTHLETAMTEVSKKAMGAAAGNDMAMADDPQAVKVDDPAGDPAAAGSSGVPDCDAYLAALDKFLACDKVPEQAKAGAKAGSEQLKRALASLQGANVPASAKKAAADGCKQAISAIELGIKQMGCAP
jgi:hypothetical protein